MLKRLMVIALLSAFFLRPWLQAQFPDARQAGEEVLYEALLGAKGFFIVVTSNGCTEKKSFQVDTLKQKRPDGSLHYVFTVRRKAPDECKRMPERIIIHFDLEKDLGLKGRFTYSLSNQIFPAAAEDQSLYSILEKYFSPGEPEQHPEKTPAPAKPVQAESGLTTALKDELNQVSSAIKSELKQALIFAIESEIDRYRRRGDQDKVEELNQQLRKFQAMSDSEFPMPPEEPGTEEQPLLAPSGPVLPPRVIEAQIIVSQPLKLGTVLEVAGLTKSGPFYHLAGSRGDILNRLQPGRKHQVFLCLLYKREYFGQIPNYYVYLAGIKEN